MPIKNRKLNSKWLIDTIRAEDSTPLRYGLYKANEKPKHLILFLNGRTEWIEKYNFLPELLNLPESTAFLTMDHRGQGASGGARGDIDSYDTFAADTKHVLDHAGLDLPYSLMAHSMGGLIALYSVLTEKTAPIKIVLSSPLLGFPQTGLRAKIIKPVMRGLARTPIAMEPCLLVSGKEKSFEENPYTHDEDKFKLIINAPYWVPAPSYRWIKASLDAIETVFDKKNIKKLKAPLLVLGGTKETVVSQNAFQNWVEHAVKHTDIEITYRKIEGAKHELFNESFDLSQKPLQSCRHWLKEAFLPQAGN